MFYSFAVVIIYIFMDHKVGYNVLEYDVCVSKEILGWL